MIEKHSATKMNLKHFVFSTENKNSNRKNYKKINALSKHVLFITFIAWAIYRFNFKLSVITNLIMILMSYHSVTS